VSGYALAGELTIGFTPRGGSKTKGTVEKALRLSTERGEAFFHSDRIVRGSAVAVAWSASRSDACGAGEGL